MDQDTKYCPHCGKQIKMAAIKCRWCGTWLNDAPVSPDQSDSSCPSDDYNNPDYATPGYDNPEYSSPGYSSPDYNCQAGETLSQVRVSFGQAMKGQFSLLRDNGLWLLLNCLVYVLTLWIPYLNIGTTIAMFHLPSLIARDQPLSRIFIFDSHYRRYMIEFLQLLFTKFLKFFCLGIPSMMFGGVPVVILSIRWRFAEVLMLDYLIDNRSTDANDVMSRSAHYSYGSNWTAFISGVVTNLLLIVVTAILCGVLGTVDFFLFKILVFLVVVAALTLFLSLNQTREAVFYKHLFIERT